MVVDTNVVYAGLYSNAGASYQILELIQQEKITPILSVALFEEYCDVLGRPPLADDFTANDRDSIMNFLCKVGYLTDIFFLWRPFLRDPKDDLVLEAAVAGNAKYILTHNMKDFKGVEAFGILAIKPGDFLEKEGAKL